MRTKTKLSVRGPAERYLTTDVVKFFSMPMLKNHEVVNGRAGYDEVERRQRLVHGDFKAVEKILRCSPHENLRERRKEEVRRIDVSEINVDENETQVVGEGARRTIPHHRCREVFLH